MSKRRYNEQQIGAILQRSGEIQAGLTPEVDSHGLTLEELQKVASEVGIEPFVVEQAALEVDSTEVGARKGVASGPRVLDHTIDGAITDEQWEDMVIRLRQHSGKSGTSTLHGSTREWTSDSDMGSLTLTAATRNGRTRFRLLGDTSGVSAVGWILGLTFGLLGVLIMSVLLGKKAGMEGWLVALVAAMTSSLVIGLTATMTKSWEKKSQRALGKVFTEIISMAGSTAPVFASASASRGVEEDVVQNAEA